MFPKELNLNIKIEIFVDGSAIDERNIYIEG